MLMAQYNVDNPNPHQHDYNIKFDHNVHIIKLLVILYTWYVQCARRPEMLNLVCRKIILVLHENKIGRLHNKYNLHIKLLVY